MSVYYKKVVNGGRVFEKPDVLCNFISFGCFPPMGHSE